MKLFLILRTGGQNLNFKFRGKALEFFKKCQIKSFPAGMPLLPPFFTSKLPGQGSGFGLTRSSETFKSHEEAIEGNLREKGYAAFEFQLSNQR